MMRGVWIALGVALGACSAGEGELFIDLRTDLVPEVELGEVQVQVVSEGLVVDSETYRARPSDAFLDGHRVAEFELPRGAHLATVMLRAPDGRVIGSRRAAATVQGVTAITVVFTRRCLDFDCPDATSPADATECDDGRCVPPSCTEETPEACPPDTCVDASMCPDSPSDCARAACLGGACFLEVRGGTCGPMEACSPELGCVPLEPGMDGGVGDAGPPDSGAPDGGAPDGGPADSGPPDGGSDIGPPGTDSGPVECRSPAECDDGNPCTDDDCVGSMCRNTNNTAGCNDGNACTTADRCAGGSCVGGPAPSCNDSNPCTDDRCVPATGCQSTNNTATCDDGNICTVGDRCSGGSCSGGSPRSCNDSNECTDDRCVPGVGCQNTPNSATMCGSCATGTCSGGVCMGAGCPFPLMCICPGTCGDRDTDCP